MLEMRTLLAGSPAITFAPPVRAYSATYENVSPDPVDLNGDSKKDMVITDSSGSAAKVMVLLNNGSGGFGAGTQVWSGTVTPRVDEVDLNGDGKPDLIISTSGSFASPTGAVDVLINNGSGGFAAPVHVYTGGMGLSVDEIDLNGDSRPDLIIEDMSSNVSANSKVVVTLNNGSGAFATKTTIWTGTGTASVTTAELTHDNRPDIVLTKAGSFPLTSGSVSVLLNNGSGGFSAAASVYTGTGFTLSALAADLNGDNAADLVITEYGIDGGTVTVLLNSGTGTFGATDEVWTGLGIPGTYTANLNGDTRPDLVITQFGDGDTIPATVDVLLNDGSGAFGAPDTVYTGSGTAVMAIPVDFNGDGRPELLIEDWGDPVYTVLTLLNDGSGGFAAPVQVWSGANVPMVQPVDVTGDSRPDLIISQTNDTPGGLGSVDVLKNNGSGGFGAGTRVYNGIHPTVLTIPLDLNGDSKFDLLVEDYDTSAPAAQLMALLNGGSGDFGTATQVWSGTDMPAIIPVDLTNDNLPDLVLSLDGAGAPLTGTVDVMLNTSTSGTSTNHAPTGIALSSTSVAEGLPAATTVGTFSATDADAGNTFTYSFITGAGSSDNGSFSIVGNALKTAASFVYATKNSYSVRVRVTDQGGLTYDKVFTISVTQVAPTNHAPTDIALSSTSVDEGLPAATTVGTFGATDADAGNTFTYSFISGAGSTDNGSFSIVGNTLKTGASFVYATKNSYSIRVRVTDQGGLTFDKPFTISVTQAAPTNHAPTDVALSGTSVAEGLPAGTTVGTLSATDADAGNTFTYSLVAGTGSADNGSFTIAGSALKTAASFVYATKNSYSIRVRVTDQGGLTYEKVFTISVTQVAPVLDTFGMVSGKAKTFAITDGDGDQVTLSLTGGGTGTIDASRQINLTGTTAKSVMLIKMKKGKTGDGYFSISGITADGVLKSITAASSALHGDLLVNTGNAPVVAGSKLAISLSQVIDGNITSTELPIASLAVQDWENTDAVTESLQAPSIGTIKAAGRKATATAGMLAGNFQANISASSITSITVAGALHGTILTPGAITTISAAGGISDSRIVATGGIKTITTLSLLNSDILVGVANATTGHFASSSDFVNPAAKLTALTVGGKTLPKGSTYPAYVSGSHISAPTVGTVSLSNVAQSAGPIVHVDNDLGTLKVLKKTPVNASVADAGTWSKAGIRPAIWQVV